MSLRVLFLTDYLPPYRQAFLELLSEEKEIDLHVFYLSKYQARHAGQKISLQLPNKPQKLPGFELCLFGKVLNFHFGWKKTIEALKPHVVVLGTNLLSSPVAWKITQFADRTGIKIIRFEGLHLDYLKHFFKYYRWRMLFYRIYYQKMDAFFCYSHKAKSFIESFDIPSEKVVLGYNVGNVEKVQEAVAKYRESENFKKERSFYPRHLFLFMGRFTKDKNVIGAIQSLDALERKDVGILILGRGPLIKSVQYLVERVKNVQVFLKGFVPSEKTTAYLALADYFVLPSFSDIASIALTEALGAGLFCYASIHDGSTENFIQEKVSGLSIDPSHPKDFEMKLQEGLSLSEEGKLDRTQIQKTMNEYTLKKYVGRLAHVIREVSDVRH